MLLEHYRGAGYALASALLFGNSTPLSKALIGDIHPVLLAAVLYFSSGLGLLLVRLCQRLLLKTRSSTTAKLGVIGSLWLGGAILSGGVIAPILLMVGLTQTPGSTASLLLNLEGVLTALLAWLVFGEHFNRRLAIGMASIVTGAIILSWQGEPTITRLLGPLLVVGACLAWGIDNNFTRKVSSSDPVTVAMLKGLVAGSFTLCVAFSIETTQADPRVIGAASLVGFINYGISNVLFVLALRELGTARTAVYYSTAPFFGALIALIVLQEAVTVSFLTAAALMGFGVLLHLTKRPQSHYPGSNHDR
jgi:drug/metabolite transporter (DMT)-like permease